MAVVNVSEPAGPPPYASDPNRPKPRRHEEYYFEDGNLVIQVLSNWTLWTREDLTGIRYMRFFSRYGMVVSEGTPSSLRRQPRRWSRSRRLRRGRTMNILWFWKGFKASILNAFYGSSIPRELENVRLFWFSGLTVYSLGIELLENTKQKVP